MTSQSFNEMCKTKVKISHQQVCSVYNNTYLASSLNI